MVMEWAVDCWRKPWVIRDLTARSGIESTTCSKGLTRRQIQCLSMWSKLSVIWQEHRALAINPHPRTVCYNS